MKIKALLNAHVFFSTIGSHRSIFDVKSIQVCADVADVQTFFADVFVYFLVLKTLSTSTACSLYLLYIVENPIQSLKHINVQKVQSIFSTKILTFLFCSICWEGVSFAEVCELKHFARAGRVVAVTLYHTTS